MSELARSRIAALRQESAHAVELAELASLAVRVDAGLLRRLRLELLPAAEPGAESDLWFSPLVESRSGSGFQMVPDALLELREHLAGDRARVAHVRRVTAAAHADCAPAILLEEELNGLALEYGDAAQSEIENRVKPLLRTLAGEESKALYVARWMVQATARLDSRVKCVPAVQALLLASALRVRSYVASDVPHDATRLGEFAWALPSLASVARRRLSATFVHGGVRFEEAQPAGDAIETPDVDPVLVEMEWEDDGQIRRRTAEAKPGSVVELSGNPNSVALTTLVGRRFRLSRVGDDRLRRFRGGAGGLAGGAARTFISYSRKDGAEYAAWLRAWLGEHDLPVWQDIVALEGGRDWWSQIEGALMSKALQHFILVVTPAALPDSPSVRSEIRLARQEGKTVCLVKGPGLTDLGALPRWLGQVYDLDLSEHQTTLIRVLQAGSRQKRVPMMAPLPPADFVQRPREFDALKARLLDAKGDAAAPITAALLGEGGCGKTTLAMALAHDRDIQDAFFDGILWAELGEKPERLLSILTYQIEVLTGERPGLETINAAAAKFSEALGDRRILLIVDDVWREQDLRPFLQGGPNCVRLVTTRIDSVLPQTAVRRPVDAMQTGEALSLISAGLPEDQVARERANLAKLAARLGGWAQLLKIVNGFVRDGVVKGEPLSIAIAGANKRLDAKGLVVFDARDETDRAKAVARTIGVSLDLLSEREQARFGELGLFTEDAEIPIGVVARLWAAAGGLHDFETEDLLSRLFDLSLLVELDLGQRCFRLHDTTRQFLRGRAGKDGLVAQHKQLVAALDGIASEDVDARTRRYFYLTLPHHLAEAGERERIDALLLNPRWLMAKLEATKSANALLADYERYGAGEAQRLIGETLRLVSGILARDPRQLLPQLIGRLAGFEAIAASGFLEAARRLLPRPSIVSLRPGLTAPGPETARLEGHADSVRALCLLPDGRLASGSSDNTIRLWDVASSAETTRLEGHTDSVRALCLLPDGRLASGSSDNTIRLWDVASGVETARLESHADSVRALCLMPDGRLVSGSSDNTIRLWDVVSAAETACLEGHTGRVRALCLLTDKRLASGSSDSTIHLWDVASGVETARLESHADSVRALCLLPDGRLVSGSSDNTIRLWDVSDRAEVARLEGHTGWVRALCLLAGGRLASGSSDNTIRLWDVASGAEVARLELDAPIYAIIAAAPNRIVAGDERGRLHWLEVLD